MRAGERMVGSGVGACRRGWEGAREVLLAQLQP